MAISILIFQIKKKKQKTKAHRNFKMLPKFMKL